VKRTRIARHPFGRPLRKRDRNRTPYPGVRLDRLNLDSPGVEPVDARIARALRGFDYEQHEVENVSAPVSAAYLHLDPDRRALIDAWLGGHAEGASHVETHSAYG
jgi:hypothetical protein